MAAITSITPTSGAFLATAATLTASDTITFNPGKKQLAIFRNGTAGALNPVIDGAAGTTVDASTLGLGVVNVAAGFTFSLAVGEQKAVILSTISAFCQGVVTITGATGVSLTLIDL